MTQLKQIVSTNVTETQQGFILENEWILKSGINKAAEGKVNNRLMEPISW